MINIELLSSQVKQMMKEKKGYRYENLYGEGYRDIKEVCIHETFELGNSDIPETLIKLYSDILTNEEISLLNNIIDGNVDGDEYSEEALAFGDICLRVTKEITGEDISECIWLCATTKDVNGYILNIIGHDNPPLKDNQIDTYNIPTNVCILSDIGCEGALLAFEL